MELEKEYLENLIHYHNHTKYVVVAWKYIREELWDRGMLDENEFAKTNNLIVWHDNSKINLDEFIPYSYGLYGDDKSNPVVKSKFKEAVKIHKSRNLHHYESLRNYCGDDWKCYVVELVCDYIAMGWEFNNYVLEYYQTVRDKIDLPREYKEYLESIMGILNEPSLHAVEEPITDEFVKSMMFKDTILEPRVNK